MNDYGRKLMVLFLTAILWSGVAPAATTADEAAAEQDVSKKIEEAMAAIKHYSVAQKDDAMQKSKLALAELDKRIDKLERRMKKDWQKMDKAAREAAQATLKKLRKQRAELAKWYDEVARSSASAWEHVKKGFTDSYDTLRESIDKAQKEF